MNSASASSALARSPLAGRTARELMTKDPVSLPVGDTLARVAALLVRRQIRAAPATDDAGHAVGVISRMDDVVRLWR
jgi:CBS domain-containing protein